MGRSRPSPAASSAPTGRGDERDPSVSSKGGHSAVRSSRARAGPLSRRNGHGSCCGCSVSGETPKSALTARNGHGDSPGIEMLTKRRSASYYGPGRADRRPRAVCVGSRAPGVPPPAVCLLIPDPEGGE